MFQTAAGCYNVAWVNRGQRGEPIPVVDSDVLRNIFREGSTNSVEDKGQRERGSGGGSPLVRDSAQFATEC
jgi:hypothetical protein